MPKAQLAELDARAHALGIEHGYGAPSSFYFDGETLTIGLFPWFSYQAMNPCRPEDDMYRVAVRWQGDDLYFLTPEDPHWAFQARWRDDHFEEDWDPEAPSDVPTWREVNGQMVEVPPPERKGLGIVTWRYARVPASEVSDSEKKLLAKRPRWNYETGCATGRRPPRD